MYLVTIALLIVGVALIALLVWARRLREEARVAARQASALELERDVLSTHMALLNSERAQLARFLASLTTAAGRLSSAGSEREIPTVLLETAVEALAPQAALIAVRRKRVSGAGRRWVIAAVHPRESSSLLGCELSWTEISGAAVAARPANRHTATALPKILAPGQAGADLPAMEIEWAVPMMAEDEVVGVIATSASGCDAALTATILESLANYGAIAFGQAVARQRARTSAQVDELTLLFNRRHILRLLSEEIRRSQQYGHELAVFLFDIDHFKRYNDVNGHMAGDVLLRLLAEFVLANVRASDTVGRFGGEEFLVILPHTAAAHAVRVANTLRTLISARDFPASAQQPLGAVTVSGGVAQFPVHGFSVSTLLRAADQALYSAKRAGRNRVACADAPTLDAHYESADLEEELD